MRKHKRKHNAPFSRNASERKHKRKHKKKRKNFDPCARAYACVASENQALSVLAMLVSRNIFHVVSALQSIASIHFWLIRSLADPTLATLMVVNCMLYLAVCVAHL